MAPMLALTFQIGPNRVALDVRHIRRVVPRVHLKPAPYGPNWLAGVFVFQGKVVPVVDLHRLIGLGDCPPNLSSRIVLVAMPGTSSSPGSGPESGARPGSERLIGMLAANVAEVRELETDREPMTTAPEEGRPDLGPVIVDEEGIMHIAAVDRLIPPSLRGRISSLGEAVS